MSEKENTQLVQRAYQNIMTGKVEDFLLLLANDVEWELPEMQNVPFAGMWKGLGGVRQFFDKVFALQDIVDFGPEEYVAQGDKVIALGRFTMRIKTANREFHSRWAHVWTVKGGEITRFYEFVDTATVSNAHTAAKRAASG